MQVAVFRGLDAAMQHSPAPGARSGQGSIL